MMPRRGAMAGMAMALAAAGALGLGAPLHEPMMRPERERVRFVDDDQRTPRNRNRGNKKLQAKIGKVRSRKPVQHGGGYPHERTESQALVERMTNWQRSQWARMGYPGLANGDAEQVRPFALRVRPYRIERAQKILDQLSPSSPDSRGVG